MNLHLSRSIYFISMQNVKFYDLLTRHSINYALATTTTMLTRSLFQKFIVYMMNNLCAKFGCHISSNKRDKQGGGIRPPQALSVSSRPGQIGLNSHIACLKLKHSYLIKINVKYSRNWRYLALKLHDSHFSTIN